MKKAVFVVLTSILCCSFVATATAQPKQPTPEEQAAAAVKTRQAVFELIRWNFGELMGMVLPPSRGGAEYNADKVQTSATRIATLAGMIPEVFAFDTREFKVQTRAQDRIWKGMDEFKDHAQGLMDAANEVANLAAGGDQQAALGAIRNMGRNTCGACHDIYRADL